MKATFVDLRQKSSAILHALNRNEPVTLLYRGQAKAVMQPVNKMNKQAAPKACEHSAFGLWANRSDLNDVARHVRKLRQGRFNDF